MEKQIILKALNIKPNIYFTDSKEELQTAKRKEEKQCKIISEIINGNGFMALEFFESNRRRILTKSNYNNIKYQLSYFDNNDLAVMHENFGGSETYHTVEELINNIAYKTFENDLIINVLYTKED